MDVPDESFFSTLSSVRISPNGTITQEIPKPVEDMDGKEVSTKYLLIHKSKLILLAIIICKQIN